MSTALFELAMSVPERVGELNTLVDHARNCEQDNEPLYNAICRATSVLLASHLEGFLKELTSALIADLNYNLGSFSNMPTALQRTFCEKIASYEGVARSEIDDRIRQLIAFFSRNSVPIDMRAIVYKESPNINATASFIDSALNEIGTPNIVGAIAGGRFDNVFDNDNSTNYILIRDLVRFRARLYNFPYRPLPPHYTFVFRVKQVKQSNHSLWHAFIEEIMTRRHKVAHGETLENETSWEDLKMDVIKLEVFIQALMYASATYVATP